MPFRAETPFLREFVAFRGDFISSDVSMPSRASTTFLPVSFYEFQGKQWTVSMPSRAEATFLQYTSGIVLA